jgi:dTDP-4-amino-4,6-dideoxy-D-galactose acyltransferase
MVEKLLVANWDSQFFGFPIGTVQCQSITPTELELLRQEARERKLNLVYIFESEPFSHQSPLHTLPLVDQKVWYTKTLTAAEVTPLKLKSVLGQPATTQLQNLALESGSLSRFKLDPNFAPEKYAELYNTWLSASLNGTKAWEVFVTMQDGYPTGLVTLEEHSGTASIGLLAVSPQYRGQGLGKELVQGALNAAWQRGFTRMEIVTQGKNHAARSLYERFGFVVGKIENVYHLWSNAGTS